jgi:pimeloyl-ACP methyl ester carboxylesterase
LVTGSGSKLPFIHFRLTGTPLYFVVFVHGNTKCSDGKGHPSARLFDIQQIAVTVCPLYIWHGKLIKMKNIPSKTIVFITGAFVGNNCWDEWRAYFENKGYKTLAPPWPHKEASPEELRNRQPDAGIASIRLAALTEYFENIIRKLPEKPILIGHSMGGLITQILLQRNVAVAGVAIHSVPPLGVFTFKLSFYKASWGALGFFTSARKSFLMNFRQWQYDFTNTMNFEDQRKAYYNCAVP